MQYKNINVRFITPHHRDTNPDRWATFTTYLNENVYYRKPTFILDSIATIKDSLEKKATKLDVESKLYFDSTSTYPRFKIKDTRFQRVIKVDKCEAAIIPDVITYTESNYNYYVYKGRIDNAESIILVTEDGFKRRDITLYTNMCTLGSGIFIEGIKKLSWFPKDAILLHEGKLVFCEESLVDTLTDIVHTYPKIATEKTLDSIVSTGLDSITEETILSICDMLGSTDEAIIELGLKILQGLNVVECPTTIKCLFIGNLSTIKVNKAISTVGLQQILKQLSLNLGNFGYDPVVEMKKVLSNNMTITETDKKLTTILIKHIIGRYFDTIGRKLETTYSDLSISIKTYVS